jgi:hypothetical protein
MLYPPEFTLSIMLCREKANGDQRSVIDRSASIWAVVWRGGCFFLQSSTRSFTFLISETNPLRNATTLTIALTAVFRGLLGVICQPGFDSKLAKRADDARISRRDRKIKNVRRIGRLQIMTRSGWH